MKSITPVIFSGILFLGAMAPRVGRAASESLPATTVRFTLVSQPLHPVIQRGDAGTEGIKFGLEGGSVVKVGTNYHLITSELVGDPRAVKMKIAHWSSPDGLAWTRQSTLFESSGDFTGTDPKAALWANPLAFDAKTNRWNFFYTAYHSKPNAEGRWNINHLGRIWRAVSTVPGREGICGPYADAGIVLQPDADSQPWEGWQGTDSFHIFQGPDRWYAFYGSAQTQEPAKQNPAYARWNVGLVAAPEIAGPWRRIKGDPIWGKAENPVVTRLRSGRYVAIFDSVGLDPMSIGYADSIDGVHWSQPGWLRFEEKPGFWLHSARTPLSLIEEADGSYTLFYTGFDEGKADIPVASDAHKNLTPMEDSGRSYRCLGIARVRIEELARP